MGHSLPGNERLSRGHRSHGRAEYQGFCVPSGPSLRTVDLYAQLLDKPDAVHGGMEHLPDGAEKNTAFPSIVLIYRSGSMELGWLGLWWMYSANGYESPFYRTVGDTSVKAPFDDYTDVEVLWAKYNNGRFFFNAEFASLINDRHFVGRSPTNAMGRHVFGEMGLYAGPTRIAVMAAQTTGYVLNNPNRTISCYPMAINYQPMESYETLMFNTYAGGNNGGWAGTTLALTSDEHGQMADA